MIKRKQFVHLNSVFRDENSSSFSDFIYTFPSHIRNVVAIRLHSFDAIYNFKPLDINTTSTNITYRTSGQFHDGNVNNNDNIVYNSEHTITYNNGLGEKVTFKQITIGDKKYDIYGEYDSNQIIYSRQYIFFSLNDYTNHDADKNLVCLKNKYIQDNSHIIGKIQILDNNNFLIISNDYDCDVNSRERLHQNRFDLKKIHVKLLDMFGNIIELTSNFGFTLELDIYE